MKEQIKTDGGFSYLEEGEGPVLLLLHGLFGALSNFKDVIDQFSKSYRVIVPMLPIYSLPVLNTNIKNLAIYVRDFIAYKKLEDIIVLGNSLGGHVALVCSVEFSEKLKLMILTGSSGLYENSFGGGYPRKSDKEFLRERIQITFYDPKHATDALVDECHDMVNDRNKLIRILAFAKSAIRHNMKEDLPNIKIPVCLIWGENDNITPPEVAKEFNELIPNSDLFWIEKCGHAPMMERPEEFNQLLKSWLQKKYPN
ncbi:MAG TPA: alpha/beta hydrolase [Flavobacteriales bacterium]|nr:alpha/beta hydrolase [Flavobacteriales bacterium]